MFHVEQIKLTAEEYGKHYLPYGPWIVVEKSRVSNKIGSIYIPDKAKEDSVKFSMTGRVIAKSKFEFFENEYDGYVMGKIQVGDIVGFSSTVPVISPAPPDIGFAGDDVHGRELVTLHAGDVLGVWGSDTAAMNALESRFVPTMEVNRHG